MAKIIECAEAHYESRHVEMGKIYGWCPERAVVECNCGERETFIAFRTPTCSNCGADHAAIVGEALASRPVFWRSLNPYYIHLPEAPKEDDTKGKCDAEQKKASRWGVTSGVCRANLWCPDKL